MAPPPRTRLLGALGAVALFGAGLGVGLLTGSGGSSRRPAGGPPNGPRGTVRLVPVGYSHDPAGAAEAAAVYDRTIGLPALFDDASRAGVIATMIAPQARATVGRRLDASVRAARGTPVGAAQLAGRPVVFRNIPLAYAVTSYTARRAQVTVWNLAISGTQTLAPGADFSLIDIGLAWSGGDWKLASYRAAPGPVPATAGTRSRPVEFLTGVAGLTWFSPAP